MTEQPSYRDAGVDIAAGERAVDLMRASIARTAGPEVIGGLGGFAGLFDAAKLTAMRRPLLATSTDGVGTKVVIASRLGRYDTIGIDLVGMVVDDLVVCGAEPLFMTDYMVFGRLRPERAASILAGIAEGCVQAGCALIGGETAEHPGHFGPDDFDIAGAATGVVEQADLLGPHRVEVGDVVLAMGSSGLHSNGFSLARHVLAPGPARPGPGHPGTRRPARRRTAHPDPDLRQGLPRAGRALRGACLRPRHRGRTGRQPGPGAARRGRCRAGPVHLVASPGLRPAGRARRRPGRGDGAGVQHGRGHGRRARPPGHRPRPGRAGQPRRARLACWARSCPAPAPPG